MNTMIVYLPIRVTEYAPNNVIVKHDTNNTSYKLLDVDLFVIKPAFKTGILEFMSFIIYYSKLFLSNELYLHDSSYDCSLIKAIYFIRDVLISVYDRKEVFYTPNKNKVSKPYTTKLEIEKKSSIIAINSVYRKVSVYYDKDLNKVIDYVISSKATKAEVSTFAFSTFYFCIAFYSKNKPSVTNISFRPLEFITPNEVHVNYILYNYLTHLGFSQSLIPDIYTRCFSHNFEYPKMFRLEKYIDYVYNALFKLIVYNKKLVKNHIETEWFNVKINTAMSSYDLEPYLNLATKYIKKSLNIKISQAYIKMKEILLYMDMNLIESQTVNSYHLCEAPGMFVKVFQTVFKGNKRYTWKAVSLPENNGGFGDDYGMIKNNPSNWIIDDVLNIITLPDNINLITSDCGLDKMNYTPELTLFTVNEHIMNLILRHLNKGGIFIIKMFLPSTLHLNTIYKLHKVCRLSYIKPGINHNSNEFYLCGDSMHLVDNRDSFNVFLVYHYQIIYRFISMQRVHKIDVNLMEKLIANNQEHKIKNRADSWAKQWISTFINRE